MGKYAVCELPLQALLSLTSVFLCVFKLKQHRERGLHESLSLSYLLPSMPSGWPVSQQCVKSCICFLSPAFQL